MSKEDCVQNRFKNVKVAKLGLNTVKRGQWSGISKTPNIYHFEKYWNEGKDLIKDWGEISKVLSKNSP